MSSIEESGSLVIAQGKNEFDINSIEQNNQKEQDLFELSRDDPTLSFQIEQQKKQPFFIQISQQANTIINNQQQQIIEPKRKRKDIFDKFKKQTINQNTNTQDNLLNIFDSIFKTKNQSQGKSLRQTQVNNNLLRPMTEIVDRSKTPSAQKKERLKIFGKKNKEKEFQGILPSQLIESQVQIFQTPKSELIGSPIIKKKNSDSINLSLIENRFSRISIDQNIDFSREEQQIQNILESQIFRDEEQKQTLLTQPKSKVETSPQINAVDVSPPPKIKISQQKQQAILKSNEISPQRKQTKIPQVPKFAQNNEISLVPTILRPVIGIEQSRMMRSQSSIMSNPISLQNYQDCTNGGFKPQNSMANVNNPNINDISQAFIKKQSTNTQNQIFQSRIIQSIPSIIQANIFQSQKRIPVFLRQIRKHISIYPNFYAYNNVNTSQCIKDQFNQLFNLFTSSIQTLTKLCDKVSNMKLKKKLYLSELSNSFTLEFFLHSKWEDAMKTSQFQTIRPLEPFQPREWSYQKAKAALNNYQIIVEYYKNKGIHVNIDTDKGKKKYFQIRQKFWDICGNMKLISEDIYTQLIDCQFPQHFYIFYDFLKENSPNRINKESIAKLKQLTHLYRSLKSENDLLMNSQIGFKVKQKLDEQTKYMLPY